MQQCASRRIAGGLSKLEATRCLEGYIAREVFGPVRCRFWEISQPQGDKRKGVRGADARPSSTPSGWQKPASIPPSAASATAIYNALAETVIGLFKTEAIHRRAVAQPGAVERVDWFNTRRLLEPTRRGKARHFEAVDAADMAA